MKTGRRCTRTRNSVKMVVLSVILLPQRTFYLRNFAIVEGYAHAQTSPQPCGDTPPDGTCHMRDGTTERHRTYADRAADTTAERGMSTQGLHFLGCGLIEFYDFSVSLYKITCIRENESKLSFRSFALSLYKIGCGSAMPRMVKLCFPNLSLRSPFTIFV